MTDPDAKYRKEAQMLIVNKAKKVLKYSGIALLIYLFLFVGLGPIRRVGLIIVPEVLRSKVTVTSVCADKNRIYVFQGDNGNYQIHVERDGCAEVGK